MGLAIRTGLVEAHKPRSLAYCKSSWKISPTMRAPASTGSRTRHTRGSCSRATRESRCVARARMSRSLAASTYSTVIGSLSGTAIFSMISRASALTSQGCPRVSSKARVKA